MSNFRASINRLTEAPQGGQTARDANLGGKNKAFLGCTDLFLTPALFRWAFALAMALGSVGCLAAPDTAVLRVTGQREPSELHCPTTKGKAPVKTPALPSARPDVGHESPLILNLSAGQVPPTPAHATALKIGLWGDSHTASGTFADSLLEALRLPLAQARPSFIGPTFGLKGVRQPLRRTCLSDDWQLSMAYRTPKEGPEKYSKSLSALHTDQAGAFLGVDFRYPDAQTRVQWADIHIGKSHPETGSVLGISVDDSPETLVQLGPDSQRLRIQGERAWATLQLRVLQGPIRIEGIAPVYEGKTAVIMDVFSIPGATAKGWRVVHKDHLRSQDPLGNGYDVVMLQSGTNESLDPDFKVALYEQQISASLTRLKAAYPRARCILIGPPDAQRSSNTLRLINDSQYRLASAKGCAHWHWQKAMGGTGAAQRWLAKGWMQADLLHLTPEGYTQSARSLVSVVSIKPR